MRNGPRLCLTALMTGCLLFFCSGTTWAQGFGIVPKEGLGAPHERVLSSGSGRYVFGQISDSSKDQFMLDTVTGRLWRISETSRIGLFLKSVPYCDEDGNCSALPGGEKGSGAPSKKKQ